MGGGVMAFVENVPAPPVEQSAPDRLSSASKRPITPPGNLAGVAASIIAAQAGATPNRASNAAPEPISPTHLTPHAPACILHLPLLDTPLG